MIEIEPAPGRVSLVGTLDSGRRGPTLALNGHLDVVPAGPLDAWEHPPYEAVVADGVLHGRGSCDMKGTISAALEAARALVTSGVPWCGRIAFQLAADEETLGPHGTRALVAAGLAGAAASVSRSRSCSSRPVRRGAGRGGAGGIDEQQPRPDRGG